jgi:AcrR family transcriptional regulator
LHQHEAIVKSERSFYDGAMPRVTDDHLAARRQQILAAAGACFRRNGFHSTSMQDVIAEAGLSIGAVYRYFKSKDDLITSIAEVVLRSADQMFDELGSHEPPPPLIDAMDRVLTFVDSQTGPEGMFPLALQVWAEAQRDPVLAAFVAENYATMRRHFVAVAARAQQAGELPTEADVDAIGAVLFGMLPGYALQRILAAGPDKDTYLRGVETLIGRRSTSRLESPAASTRKA